MSEPITDREKTPSFEEALADLDQIVHELEAGETSLEDSLARYERGITLLKQCYAQLRQVEQRVVLLTGEGEDGRPLTQPFESPGSDTLERPDARRRPPRGDTSY